MKPFEFFTMLLAWNALEPAAREAYLSFESGPPKSLGSGAGLRELEEAGFLKAHPGGTHEAADEGFLRDLQFLADLGSRDLSPAETGVLYAESVYSERERDALLLRENSDWLSGKAFLEEVCTFRYYQRFIREPSDVIAKRLSKAKLGYAGPLSLEAVEIGKKILAFLLTSSRPISMHEVLRAFEPWASESFAEGFAVCLQSAVAVLSCPKDGRLVKLGLWPELFADKKAWSKGMALSPRQEEPAVLPSYLVSDFETLLLRASFSPWRLRPKERLPYRRDLEALFAGFATVFPEGERSAFFPSKQERLEKAQVLLLRLGFLTTETMEDGKVFCRISSDGFAWLRLSFEEKYLEAVHFLRDSLDGGQEREVLSGTWTALFETGKAFDLEELLDYAVYRLNPFLGSRDLSYGEALGHWRKLLSAHLRDFLLPFGGLKIALSGNRTILGLSTLGGFLLGEEPAPSFDAEMLPAVEIFPDCRISVTRPAPEVERRLATISEPLGCPGWFRLSEKAVLRAAAGGIPLEVLVGMLEGLAGGKVPREAKEALSGWYAAAGEAELVEGFLVECPDRASAKKFLALPLHPEPRRLGPKLFLVNAQVTLDEIARLCRLEGIAFKGPRSPGRRFQKSPN